MSGEDRKVRLLVPRPGGARWSDVDPALAVHAAKNRLRQSQGRAVDRISAILDRLEEADRKRAERDRAARDERIKRGGR